MRTFDLSTEFWVPQPLESVFLFFSDADNLNLLTPPWLHFKILTSLPIRMETGALIDYKLRLHGVPINWQTEIVDWEPPFRFVDRQIKGPYRKWIHTHSFQVQDGGTRIQDHVEYAISVPFLEALVNRFLVKPDLDKIFQYRKQKLSEHYGITVPSMAGAY